MIEYVIYAAIGLVLAITICLVYNDWREQSRFHRHMRKMDRLVLEHIRNLNEKMR